MNGDLYHFHSSIASTASPPRLHLAILLCLLLLNGLLLANLPYDCSTCSGTEEECNCNEEEAPLDGEEAVDGARCCGSEGASFGSLKLSVPFGRPLHEELNLQSQFSLYAVSSSPLVYTTQYLQYRNRLLDRILQTEVAPAHCGRILGADWEDRLESLSVFGRVVTNDTLTGNVTHLVRLLGARREPVVFQFMLGDSVGRPVGEKATLRLTLRMRDLSGNDTVSVPYYYDLCFGNGSFVRYAASDGRVVSCTSSTGRTVTPAEVGLESIWDDSGIIRQVKSDRDGLADVVALKDSPGYEIRLYASSQINGKAGGLYTVTGVPHTVWRVSNPNAGKATHVHITRITADAEETTVYEYSSNSDGWMKTSPDSATVISSRTQTDMSRTLKSVTVTECTRTGTVASRTLNLVRKYSFGERIVSSTRDPDGARVRTVWEYYSEPGDAGNYGRKKTESLPDGGWTTWHYDAQGRVTAITTPWKNSAFGSVGTEARTVFYSYSPVDARDIAEVTDIRPRAEETRILGVITSKTYYAYYTDNGCRVEVKERCVRQNASYGDTDNLRTVKRWYPAGSGASFVTAGRLHTVLGEDGQMTTYAYERGNWTPGVDDTSPGVFAAVAGSSLRIIETLGTSAHPEGIPFRTLRLISVMDAAGNKVFTERQVYTGSGYVRLDWASYAYDFRNRLIRKYQSNGELTETTWNCCAKASETLPEGRTYLYEYDAQRRLVAKTLAGSGVQPDYVTEYTYDAAGNITATTASGGGLSLSSSSIYDQAGRQVMFISEAGLVTRRSYLTGVNAGNLRRGETITVTHPGGAQSINSYYCDGRVASVTGDAQVSQYYDYGVNADGTLWTLVRLGGGASPRWEKTTTDLLGRVRKTERPWSNEDILVTENHYDNAGRLVRITQAGLADTLYEYDELGNIARIGQDANGNGALDLASSDRITETTSAYMQDVNNAWWGRSTQSVYATIDADTPTTASVTEERLSGFADGVVSESRETDIHGNTTVATTTINRDAKTVTKESLLAESSVAEQHVTVNGLTTSVRSKSNLTTVFGYDGLRRRVSVTAPRTGTSTVTYDAQGRVSSTIDAANNTTSYGYDAAGRLAWRRNALGKYARYAYNSRGQQTRVWGDTEYPVEYGYDQYGQKVTMTTFRSGTSWNGESWPDSPPVGDTTTWNYDGATGLLISKAYADGYGTSYTYTVDGKPATRTWARKDAQGNELVTVYSYNQFGELTAIDYSDSTPDITYAYNRFGKLSQVTDVVGTRTFAYNATLDEVSETIAGLYVKTLTRTYTSTGFKGQKKGLSIDNIPHYTYGYDTYGRMNQLTIPSGNFVYTCLANSDLVSQMTRPNGITTTWSYEQNRDYIIRIQNGIVSTYEYVNDAIGQRRSLSRSGSAYATSDTIFYTYNDRSELTGALSDVDTTYSYSYIYDPIGNRISASEAGVSWTYTTNSLNQYTFATENNVQLSFAYDQDGSMTYHPVDATSGWTQVWNCENRLIETYNGSERITFKYDYMGRRVEKCVYSGNFLASKTCYVYDDFKCVEELSVLDNNTVAMRHVWQPFNVGLDVILATFEGNESKFYLHDINKNVKQVTESNGILLEGYTYTPFGKNHGNSTAYIGFSSEIFDARIAKLYYNYRYYDTFFGRWSKTEPVKETGHLLQRAKYNYSSNVTLHEDINSYISFSNNPISYFDSQGEIAGTIAIAIGGTAGAGITLPVIIVGTGIAVVGITTIYWLAHRRETCEKRRPCNPNGCNPPANVKFNIEVHTTHDHGDCLGRTGSMTHWHYDVYNQNPDTCDCFLSKHRFGGCGNP